MILGKVKIRNKYLLLGTWKIGEFDVTRNSYLCTCIECGSKVFRTLVYLNTGKAICKSCKLSAKGRIPQDIPKNFISQNRELYKRWWAFVDRCHNPNSSNFHLYGARGITVCEEWRSTNGLITFKQWLVELYPNYLELFSQRYDLDRKDNNGNYCPENCRLISRKENLRNRRNIRKARIGDQEFFLSDLVDKGLSYSQIQAKLNKSGQLLNPEKSSARIKVNFMGEETLLWDLVENFSLLDYLTVYRRISRGWDIESALVIPLHGRKGDLEKLVS